MIEIKIKIKEKVNQELDEQKITCCEVEFEETGIHATEGEKKTSELMKQKLNVNKKLQVENLSKKKSKDEIVEELLKLLH